MEPTELLSTFEDVSRHNNQPIIKLAFFTMSKEHSWWKRKWTEWSAWFTGQYTEQHIFYDHVELRFSRGQVTSINYNYGRVYMVDEKMLDRSGYSCFYQTSVTRAQQRRMQEMAQHFVDKNIPFNLRGMLCNFTPGFKHCLGIDREGQAVFCSEYIVHVLQAGGIFVDMEASKTSPNDLFRAVRHHPDWYASYNRELSMTKLHHK